MPLVAIGAPTGFRQTFAAAFLALGMAATVGGALLFQHVGGYIPCALCLEQRTPYYLAVPVAVLALVARLARAPTPAVRVLLIVVAGLMAWGAALGAYHAGVEWGWWAGPADCAVGGAVDLSGDLLAQLDAIRAPSCTEAALRIAGLSLAGWNAVLAAFFALVALRAALSRGDRFA